MTQVENDASTAPRDPDAFARELQALTAAHDVVALDAVARAIADGRASRDVVRRVALEWYVTAKWTTPELPLLIAGAPDVYSFTMDAATHYRQWAERFADEAGYRSLRNRVQAAVACCRQLGLDDHAVRSYTPLPETIAMTCTLLFYLRRSYEEGLAVLGYGGAWVGATAAVRDGFARHYGVTVDGPPATPAWSDAARLLGLVATTRTVQDRCRDAIRNVLLTAECRVRTTNRWVE